MSQQSPLSKDHLVIIRAILSQHLPKGTKAWIFGSRATGRARQYSDLDLLIACNAHPLADEVLSTLRDEFDECDLPYKVDLLDWHNLEEPFRSLVEKERIPLPF